MKEYDVKEYTYDMLQFLRRKTMLGPIALLKVGKAREEAERAKNVYEKLTKETINLDTSTADDLEYSYRFRAFEYTVFHDWEKYGDGLDLDEFAHKVIVDSVNDIKKTL